MSKCYYVYILANGKNGTTYVGITSDLIGRIWEHKNKVNHGFSSKYNIDRLVYYEIFNDVNEAIDREKKLKLWKRKWKIELIEKNNPIWEDLSDKLDILD